MHRDRRQGEDHRCLDALGCLPCWQEVKSKDLWIALLEAASADFVVDLGVGGGLTAQARLALGIPRVGLCWNQVHAHWLNNVVHRWALEEIVKKKSPCTSRTWRSS